MNYGNQGKKFNISSKQGIEDWFDDYLSYLRKQVL